MNKFMRVLFGSIVSLIVVAVTPVAHVSAMQSTSMHHGASSSVSMSEHCTMLCQNSEASKENKLRDSDSEEDDEPQPPYYLQFDSVNSGFYVQKEITAQTVHPSDKVPKYRSCCVIRR